MMNITAYVDDSGSEPCGRVYVLGGVALPSLWWEYLQSEWSSTLSKEPCVGYFKSSELWDKKKGPFRDFDDGQRINRLYALCDVLCKYEPMAVSCSLRWAEFQALKEELKLSARFSDPYFFLFYRLLVLMIQWGQREKNRSAVNFVFDEQNDSWPRAKGWYEDFRKLLSKDMIQYLGADPEKADEKICVPLQAADMFAWYQRRASLGELQQEWHQAVQRKLTSHHTSVELDRESLCAMCQEFGLIVK